MMTLPLITDHLPSPAGKGETESAEKVWPVHQVVADLHAIRAQWRSSYQRHTDPGSKPLPSRKVLGDLAIALRSALFPMRLGPPELRPANEDFYVGHTLDTAFNTLYEQVRLELLYGRNRKEVRSSEQIDHKVRHIVKEFAVGLPRIRQLLDSDVIAAYRANPSARSIDEVLLCFPGVLAIIHHRLAHLLYRLGAPLLARIMAEHAHAETGIDIHPGAQIGRHFSIEHGTGLVIGETAIIGEHVRLYQAVTLGAKIQRGTSEDRLDHTLPRHPVIEDQVVIYAGATILGHVTVGRGSVIGGNVWLTRSVPANSIVTQSGILHETLSQDGAGI